MIAVKSTELRGLENPNFCQCQPGAAATTTAGGSASTTTAGADTTNANIIKAEFGQLTPENSMKWDAIEPSNGGFSYTGAGTLVNSAQADGKLIRGHTLGIFFTLPHKEKKIFFSNLFLKTKPNTSFSLAFAATDVVNEIFNENGSLRSSSLLNESFVTIAFAAAKTANPTAKLYINNYNLDSVNSKVAGLVNLVKKLKAAGSPIEGIGTQTHLQANGAGGVAAALSALAAAGTGVAITELDIASATPTQVITACLNLSACQGVTVWGYYTRLSHGDWEGPEIMDFKRFYGIALANPLIELLEQFFALVVG
ncbi:glycoside hydrolase [Choiromyces venosus 120613-1]|uniref:Beta-xylanase n=1 Tax=Choiromyces venosus 120613-1 TaxID=1336337 RepID=A0A3N4JVW9_9PEZI|nr:glycoside hydrolase [Choiromyces venosus 120613-1]